MVHLKNKTIVVTGAGRGIGAAVARACAALGARVVVNDVDAAPATVVAQEIREAGGEALADHSDISTWDGAQALIRHCVEAFGGIQGLVNNAGIYRLGLPDELPEHDLRALVQVNLMGTLFCTTHAVPHLRAAGGGAIVNVTSGAQLGLPAMSVYGATKGAVAAYTYGCAVDLQADNIRVNAISPLAQTRMGQVNTDYYARQDKVAPPIPNQPHDNATAVCFLLSDQALGITGQVLRIDGHNLCLMTHPAMLQPAHAVEPGSADSVARVFDQALRAALAPLGLAAVTATGVAGPRTTER